MDRCKCGSYAINPRLHGRNPNTDLDLCDVCYFKQRLAEAEAKLPRWIPVSEGLPPPIGRWPSVYGSEWVIASYRWNGAVFIGECRFVHGKKQAWKTSNDDYDIEVTHWMPLPEPPESGKGE